MKISESITVVIPVYNAEALIGRTIQSVIDQSYVDWEIIVVDDCSSDRTREVVETYVAVDSRIRLIALETNNGCPAVPRNIGIKVAEGMWIALLDSDDIWHPDKLKYQLRAAEEMDVSFVCSKMLNFTDEAEIVFGNPGKVEHEPITLLRQKVKGVIPNSSVMAKRSLLLKFPFNEDKRYRAVEDYHCWLRIHEDIRNSIKLKFPFLLYRHVEGQISGSKISMVKKVFMVHREYPGSTMLLALLFTITHVIGAVFYRKLRKSL